jgi:hypothetical protein
VTKVSITERILAIEEHLLAVERRVEDNVKAALKGRLVAIEERLASIKARLLDDLKRELRHLLLEVALAAVAIVLALIGAAFLVTSAWLTLQVRFGATVASCTLGVAFLLASVVPAYLMRFVVNRKGVTNPGPM